MQFLKRSMDLIPLAPVSCVCSVHFVCRIPQTLCHFRCWRIKGNLSANWAFCVFLLCLGPGAEYSEGKVFNWRALWWMVDMLFWERGTQVELCVRENTPVCEVIQKKIIISLTDKEWAKVIDLDEMSYSFLTSSMASNRQVQAVCLLLRFPFS